MRRGETARASTNSPLMNSRNALAGGPLAPHLRGRCAASFPGPSGRLSPCRARGSALTTAALSSLLCTKLRGRCCSEPTVDHTPSDDCSLGMQQRFVMLIERDAVLQQLSRRSCAMRSRWDARSVNPGTMIRMSTPRFAAWINSAAVRVGGEVGLLDPDLTRSVADRRQVGGVNAEFAVVATFARHHLHEIVANFVELRI